MQSHQLSIPLLHRGVRFAHKLLVPLACQSQEVLLRRLVSDTLLSDDHALDQSSYILSTVLERAFTVRVRAQNQRHVHLECLQLSAVVLMLVGLEGVDHAL